MNLRDTVTATAEMLEQRPFTFDSPAAIAKHLRDLLAHTEEPQGAIVGTLHVDGTTPEQLRLSALSEAVTAAASHMSTEEPTETVKRARAFYAFLAAEDTQDGATDA